MLSTLFVVAAVPFAPTEAVLITASALAAAGHLPLLAVIVVGALGCSTSDIVNYGIGRFFGASALARVRRRRTSAAVLDWVADQLHARPVLILVVARFLPAGGIVAAVLCGATRFPKWRFVPISLLGSTAWTVYTAMLGYLGTTITNEPVLGILVGLATAAVLAALTGYIGRRLGRSRAGGAGDGTNGTGGAAAVGELIGPR